MGTRHRVFVDTGDNPFQEEQQAPAKENVPALLDYIQESEIGRDELIPSPFGDRVVCYTDYTASGRALSFIEDYLRTEVLPVYGNTHGSNSKTSTQTTLFRHEARGIVQKAVNANWETDVVLFTGTGSTGAILQMVGILGLTRGKSAPLPPAAERPVVFVGPFEHHSNILPWRESIAEVVQIAAGSDGVPSLADLKARLAEYKDRPLKIGSFSAASNVTGLLCDTVALSVALHEAGALAMWDYAAAAPHVTVDMNPPAIDKANTHLGHKDAIFISPHKFPGGPGCPGVLVVKKALLDKGRSAVPGGGTIFYVTEEDHQYADEDDLREEGGTPDIVGSIRCGLVFQLKEAVGADVITQREEVFMDRALGRLSALPNFVLLGPEKRPHDRLAVLPFLIRHEETGRFLHYNFVVALLNDLFGIQARGGCLCAGPYGQFLLGMDLDLARKFERALNADDENELLRPGFVRLNLPYFQDDATIDFVIDAVAFVAEHGHVFLPQYQFVARTNEWRHVTRIKMVKRRWLAAVSYSSGKMAFPKMEAVTKDPASHRKRYLEAAKDLAAEARANAKGTRLPDHVLSMPAEVEMLRWFVVPSEARDALVPGSGVKAGDAVIRPRSVFTREAVAVPAEVAQDAAQDVGMLLEMPEGLSDDDDDVPAPTVPREVRAQWHVPSKKMMKTVNSTIRDFDMIKEGDRVLVGLSGGKDSLSLLHALHAYLRVSPVKFEIGACTVDPQTEGFDPRPLKPYLASLGVPYFYLGEPLIERAKGTDGVNAGCEVSSICSWCSRMKRGMIYTCMRKEGYNVLAFGQHLDDAAESFLMSAFFNGSLRTMKAHYTVDKGDLRLIRPLMFTREKVMKEFAYEAGLPVIVDNCPGCFDAPEQRHRIKQLLSAQEAIFPNLFSSLAKAMRPLIALENPFAATSLRAADASSGVADALRAPAAAGRKGRGAPLGEFDD